MATWMLSVVGAAAASGNGGGDRGVFRVGFGVVIV
jgi:hypothetical protein